MLVSSLAQNYNIKHKIIIFSPVANLMHHPLISGFGTFDSFLAGLGRNRVYGANADLYLELSFFCGIKLEVF